MEKSILKEFTVQTEIFSLDLPEKVAKVLRDDGVAPKPECYYDVDIIFDKNIYSNPDFYHYPIPQENQPNGDAGRQANKESAKDLIYAILSSQLDLTRAVIEEFGFLIDCAAIIGDEHGGGVTIVIYEREKPLPVQGRKTQKHFRTCSIMPDRPFIQEQAVKFMADIFLQKIREEGLNEFIKKTHKPNLIPADKVFLAICEALLEGEVSGIEKLKFNLLSGAQMKSDWPLHICSRSHNNAEGTIEEDALLDCSEHLIFKRELSGSWELIAVNNLKDAGQIIAKDGFNKEQTETIIVLHNLQPVRYSMHIETKEGLRSVSIKEARGNKKLIVSWD